MKFMDKVDRRCRPRSGTDWDSLICEKQARPVHQSGHVCQPEWEEPGSKARLHNC